MTDWYSYSSSMLALVAWREARGEGRDGMRAVMHVIRNRVLAQHGDWLEVITRKWQFSSLTAPGDPMLVQWPIQDGTPGAQAFSVALSLVDSVMDGTNPDITQGATHYFNPHVVLPAWAAGMSKVCSIGNHDFYKEQRS